MRSLRLAAVAAIVALASAAQAKTLVYCSEGSPEALNPQLVTTTTGMNATRPIFDNLVQFAPGTTQIEPALAESWTISDDGLVYTFRLRAGVKFQSNRWFKPTRDLTAQDVIFSIERQWKSDHPFHRVSGASFDYFQDLELGALLKSVEAVDGRTVRITLTRPEAPLLADFAMPFAAIHSAEYADEMLRAGTPEKIDQDPIGTGPFAFVSYHRDVAVRYRAFAEHWAGRQAIDGLVFSITPNPIVRLTKLKAGECHVMAFPAPSDASGIEATPDLQLHRQEGLNIGYLAINTTREPFNDVRVRRAINLAIDKAAIVSTVYEGVGTPAKNPIPPTLWGYEDGIQDYPYDPAQAQRLLIEAGYAEGFDSELWFMPVSRPYNPNAKRTAELIQIDLAKVGIRVKLVTDDWNRYRARIQAGEHPMALFGWTGDNADPDNFLNMLLGCTSARPGGNNVSKWCDKHYDALVVQAKQVSARSEREKLYRQAQVIFKREAPWVPLAHSVVLMATRKDVKGFRMDPLGRTLFEGVDLKQ